MHLQYASRAVKMFSYNNRSHHLRPINQYKVELQILQARCGLT